MLVVRTFSGLAVEHDGAVCEGAAARRKTLALLALLAAAGKKGLSRDKLIGYLWPETGTPAARHLLKQTCYAVRHDLGEPDLFLGRDELRLNPAVASSDIQAFEDALESGDRDRAAALYTGPFLDGFYLNGAGEFERWVETERARIAQRACAVLEALAGDAAGRGDHARAAELWRRLATLDPLNVRVAVGVMNALVAAGDRAGALQFARVHERLLRDELDAAPDPAIVELAERLRESPTRLAARQPSGAVRAYGDFERRLGRDLEVEPSTETRAPVDGIRARRESASPAAARVVTRTNAGWLEAGRSLVAVPAASPARSYRRQKVLLAFVMLASLATGAWLTGSTGILWARYWGIPSLQRRIAAGDWEGAYRLAARVAAVLPHDSGVTALRARFADTVNIEGKPPGARVYRRPYNAPDAEWEFLGVAPIRALVPRLPVVSEFKLEAPGFFTGIDIGAAAADRTTVRPAVLFALPPETVAPSGMVEVTGGEVGTDIPQIDARDRAVLSDFYIGRFEVTNREYQAFVDSGGYRRRELWRAALVENGHRLSWEAAMARFVDQTGRPGPSTWEGGYYPPNHADYPVGGVSWYEAMAYARFRGSQLPNVFQWTRAARFEATGAIVAASNIDQVRGGTAPVGSFGGMAGSGTLDMAGNVREWCVNESRNRRGHYILGGGWNDPGFTFFETAIQPAFDRSATNGIRLVRSLSGHDPDTAADRAIEPYFRNYRIERPVSDETFRFYRRLYAYDRAPLHAVVERRDSFAAWTREKVSFDAAYGSERMTAYVFVPLRGHPPYQPVLFFTGSTALRVRSSDSLVHVGAFDFLVEGGRAVVYPVIKGTYERDDGTRVTDPDESNRYKQHVVQWEQDVSRTVDYLDTRQDLDTTRLGYLGFSWGGRLAGVVLSIEPRFRTAVLTIAGLSFLRAQPEADDINYMPRVHVPVLMINGRYDNTFPLETAARPMYERLGTPPDRKRLVIVGGVHYVPRNILIRETLDWFDRYLGPVR